MRILNTKTLKDGRRHLLIEVSKNEADPVPALEEHGFYKPKYPMDDMIIEGRLLTNPQQVVWDSLEQKWLDV